MTRADAACTDTDDSTLAMAARGSAITAPSTPAFHSIATAAVRLGCVDNCRCDVSKAG